MSNCQVTTPLKFTLTIAYSAGLMVSEVLKLKLKNTNTKQNMIHIKAAKSRKDRYTVFSEVALKVLRKYWIAYHLKDWFFQGQIKIVI